MSSRIVSLKFLFFLALLGALIPLGLAGWRDLYEAVLENNPPIITPIEVPRGLGLIPVTLQLRINDESSGLDELVVRLSQKGSSRDFIRKELRGAKSEELSLELKQDTLELEEGSATIEVKAFDRSLWSNSAEVTIPLVIDYRRPKIEVLTAFHNATIGGSQLIIYKAYDESLAVSGVRVGNQSFLGYPARGLDPSITDPRVFAAIYAIDLQQASEDSSVRVFAEDAVGNAVSTSFNNRIGKRTFREATFKLTEDYLRDRIARLADDNFTKFRTATEAQYQYETAVGGMDRLVEQFRLVNKELRQANENELMALLNGPRFERYWNGPFMQHPGSIVGAFGDNVTYTLEGISVGTNKRKGYQFLMPHDKADVFAVNGGIVAFSENIGVYGRTIGIDHGLGLMSVYGFLDTASVNKGEAVQIGQKIGTVGNTGLGTGNKLYYELRVHGVPVDAREWWDSQWFYGHVTAKLNDIKRSLGLAVYKPLQ